MTEMHKGRPVREIVRGLAATRNRGGVWIVHGLKGKRVVEYGRFRGELPMFPGNVASVSMRIYDDGAAEYDFLTEGVLDVFDERVS